MRLQVKQTREGVHHYALVRKQEIEGFMDGLFGSHEEMDLPESARDGVDALGAINLLDDTGKPAPPDELNGLADNLQALATILEKELNIVVLSCTRARRQLREKQASKPTRDHAHKTGLGDHEIIVSLPHILQRRLQ